MITFVLYALSAITGSAVPGTVYWLTGLVDGVVFLPFMTLVAVPYLGRISREKIGRLHYLQSVFPMEAVALVLTPWGYEFAPVVETTVDGESIEVARLADGTRLEIGDQQAWYRLGNRRFAITYLPDERVLGHRGATAESMSFETVVVEDETTGQREQREAIFDRGGILETVRGGFHGWTPHTDSEAITGILVSLSRTINGLRGGGGVRLSERTERMTRVEHGGKPGLSNRGQMWAYLGVIVVGSAFTTLAMWLMG